MNMDSVETESSSGEDSPPYSSHSSRYASRSNSLTNNGSRVVLQELQDWFASVTIGQAAEEQLENQQDRDKEVEDLYSKAMSASAVFKKAVRRIGLVNRLKKSISKSSSSASASSTSSSAGLPNNPTPLSDADSIADIDKLVQLHEEMSSLQSVVDEGMDSIVESVKLSVQDDSVTSLLSPSRRQSLPQPDRVLSDGMIAVSESDAKSLSDLKSEIAFLKAKLASAESRGKEQARFAAETKLQAQSKCQKLEAQNSQLQELVSKYETELSWYRAQIDELKAHQSLSSSDGHQGFEHPSEEQDHDSPSSSSFPHQPSPPSRSNRKSRQSPHKPSSQLLHQQYVDDVHYHNQNQQDILDDEQRQSDDQRLKDAQPPAQTIETVQERFEQVDGELRSQQARANFHRLYGGVQLQLVREAISAHKKKGTVPVGFLRMEEMWKLAVARWERKKLEYVALRQVALEESLKSYLKVIYQGSGRQPPLFGSLLHGSQNAPYHMLLQQSQHIESMATKQQPSLSPSHQRHNGSSNASSSHFTVLQKHSSTAPRYFSHDLMRISSLGGGFNALSPRPGSNRPASSSGAYHRSRTVSPPVASPSHKNGFVDASGAYFAASPSRMTPRPTSGSITARGTPVPAATISLYLNNNNGSPHRPPQQSQQSPLSPRPPSAARTPASPNASPHFNRLHGSPSSSSPALPSSPSNSNPSPSNNNVLPVLHLPSHLPHSVDIASSPHKLQPWRAEPSPRPAPSHPVSRPSSRAAVAAASSSSRPMSHLNPASRGQSRLSQPDSLVDFIYDDDGDETDDDEGDRENAELMSVSAMRVYPS